MQRRACGVTNRVIQKAQPDSAIPVLFAPRRHHNVRPTDFSRNDERFLQWKLLPNISVQAYGASARAVPLAFQYMRRLSTTWPSWSRWMNPANFYIPGSGQDILTWPQLA